jgi:hypothetical protein
LKIIRANWVPVRNFVQSWFAISSKSIRIANSCRTYLFLCLDSDYCEFGKKMIHRASYIPSKLRQLRKFFTIYAGGNTVHT